MPETAQKRAISRGKKGGPDLNARLNDHYREERLPRYTSYSTAPNFTTDVSAAIHGDWLSSIEKSATGSLNLHVPFCRSMRWYCGCHATVVQRDAPISDYLTVLRREIELVSAKLSPPLRCSMCILEGERRPS
jgi:oxygen-independent coproporphyrinogen III oxidase